MSNSTDPSQVLTMLPLLPETEEIGGSTAHDIASWVARVDPPGAGFTIVPTGQVAAHCLYAGANVTIGSDLPPDLEPVGWDPVCPPIPTGAPGTVGYVWARIASGDSDDSLVIDFAGPDYLADGRIAEWAGVKDIIPWPRDTNNSFVTDLSGIPGIYQIWLGYVQLVPMPWRMLITETFDEARTVGLIAPDGLPPSGSQMVAMANGAIGWYQDGYPGEPALEVRVVEVFRCPARFGVADPPRMTTPGFRG